MSKQSLIVLGIFLVVALVWSALRSKPAHARIDGKQAQELVRNGARLIDVRTAAEYADKHLPNAVNIPVQQLGERTQELEPKDKAIVVYCRSGHRSGIAFDQLAKAGFTKLYDLGPMTAW